jgi:pentatricopeptide repeat protein
MFVSRSLVRLARSRLVTLTSLPVSATSVSSVSPSHPSNSTSNSRALFAAFPARLFVTDATPAEESDDSADLLASMQRENVAAKRHSPCHPYNLRMTKAAEDANFDGVLDVYNELLAAGVQPNIVAVNHAMNAHARKGNASAAAKLLESIQDKVQPNIWTFNAALRSCIARGDATRAVRFMELAKEKGIALDAYSYQFFITATARADAFRQALTALEEMQSKGFTPSASVYQNLLRSAISAPAVRVTETVLQQAIAAAVPLDAQSVASAIALFAQNRAAEPALSTLKYFCERFELKLDSGVVIALLDTTYARRSTELLDAVMTLIVERHGAMSNPLIAEAVFAALAATGRWSTLWSMIAQSTKPASSSPSSTSETASDSTLSTSSTDASPSSPLQLGPRSLDAVALAMAREADELDRAYYALEAEAARGMSPEVLVACMDAVLLGCVHRSDMDRAFATFAQYAPMNVQPTAASYAALVRVCALSRRMNTAETVLAEMRAKGFAVDEALQVVLASGYARAGRLQQVEAIVAEAEAKEGSAPLALYRVLANKLAILGKPVDELVQRVEKHGLDAASIRDVAARVTKRVATMKAKREQEQKEQRESKGQDKKEKSEEQQQQQ